MLGLYLTSADIDPANFILNLRKGISLQQSCRLDIYDNRSICLHGLLQMEFFIFMAGTDIGFGIFHFRLLEEHVPHLVIGAFVENLVYDFIFFHGSFLLISLILLIHLLFQVTAYHMGKGGQISDIGKILSENSPLCGQILLFSCKDPQYGDAL